MPHCSCLRAGGPGGTTTAPPWARRGQGPFAAGSLRSRGRRPVCGVLACCTRRCHMPAEHLRAWPAAWARGSPAGYLMIPAARAIGSVAWCPAAAALVSATQRLFMGAISPSGRQAAAGMESAVAGDAPGIARWCIDITPRALSNKQKTACAVSALSGFSAARKLHRHQARALLKEWCPSVFWCRFKTMSYF